MAKITLQEDKPQSVILETVSLNIVKREDGLYKAYWKIVDSSMNQYGDAKSLPTISQAVDWLASSVRRRL